MDISNNDIKDEDIENKQTTINYSCENCGDELIFDPETNTLKCKSCGLKVVFDEKETKIIENCFFEALENENSITIDENSKVNEIECKNCGATLVYKDNVVANKCIYCNSANVLLRNDTHYIKPEYLVPFKISQKYSNELIDKWCKQKFFMNKDFQETIKHNDFYGVYIPYWTYNSNTITHYTALKGTHYHVPVTRKVNGKTTTTMARRTHWRPVSGIYNRFFDDILIPATKNTTDIDYRKVTYFNLESLVHYDEKYITGFLAKKYDFTLKNAWPDAKVLANNDLQYEIKKQIGGDVVSNLILNTNYNDITYKHVLLPIWIYTYSYKDKVYTFLMNGQTGSIFAKYPLNWLRVILTSIITFILIVILYLLIGVYIGS